MAVMLNAFKPSGGRHRFWLALLVCIILFLIGLVFVSIGRRTLTAGAQAAQSDAAAAAGWREATNPAAHGSGRDPPPASSSRPRAAP
jgi:hypothetical protein